MIGFHKLYVVFAGLEGFVRAGKVEGFVVHALTVWLNWLSIQLLCFSAGIT